MKSFDEVTKTLKIHTLPDSMGNQLSKVNWNIGKFGIEMPKVCGHITGGGLKFLNDFLVQTRGSGSQRRAKNILFCTFSTLLGHLIPITTRNSTDIVHSVTYINALSNFCNDLYKSYQAVKYAGNGQN